MSNFVSELVNQETQQWDLELVRSLFANFTAEEILHMLVPSLEQTDRWIWAYDQSGMFSIKSFLLQDQR